MQTKFKIVLLYVLSFVLSLAPVLIYFTVNHEKYVKSVPEGIKLTFGGIIVAFLVFLKIIGKLRVPSRFVFFGLIFIFSYLFKSLLDDILVFSFLAFLGEIFDSLIKIPIDKIKEKEKTQKTADVTAKKIEEVLDKYYRGAN